MRLLLAAPLLLVALGCGAQDDPASGTATSSATPSKVDLGTSVGTFVFSPGRKEVAPREVRELYSVFFRPATSDDDVARHWADRPGSRATRPTILKRDSEKARVLLMGAGLEGEALVAAPIARDMVCFGLPSGAESCGSPFPHGVAIMGEWSVDEAALFGLVGDDVKSLEIVAGGRVHEARIGENGFACKLGKVRMDEIEQAVVHLAGDRVETFDLR